MRVSITELTNSLFTLTPRSENLYLCGVDDVGKGCSTGNVLAQMPDESAAILLAA